MQWKMNFKWKWRCFDAVSWILCENCALGKYSKGEKRGGSIVCCDGFQIEIFSDKSEEVTENVFTAAVGFEILKDSVSDAEQFAMDVIESEEKEYVRWIEGYMAKFSKY